MKSVELVNWLNQTLQIDQFDDASLNGLQFPGHEEIQQVALAVDANLTTLTQVCHSPCDFLIVHHGLFWKYQGAQVVTAVRRRYYELMISAGLNLYAVHLPLDAHPQYGNNIRLAKQLGLHDLTEFHLYKGRAIALWGKRRISIAALAQDLSQQLQADIKVLATGWGQQYQFFADQEDIPSLLINSGSTKLKPGPQGSQANLANMATLNPQWTKEFQLEHDYQIGICTGAGGSTLQDCYKAGIQVLVTGEIAHYHVAEAMELGIHLIIAGHYQTEKGGVLALGEQIESNFGLKCAFFGQSSQI